MAGIARQLLQKMMTGGTVGGAVCWLLALAAGCSPPVVRPMYGPPPVVHDPTIEVTDFSYNPASPIEVGDVLRFTARTSEPVWGYEGEIHAVIGWVFEMPGHAGTGIEVRLNDYGLEADAVAGDGLWTGEYEWTADYGPHEDLPVQAHLHWADGYVSESVSAAPLTVLAAVD